jgi:hypothetical protein
MCVYAVLIRVNVGNLSREIINHQITASKVQRFYMFWFYEISKVLYVLDLGLYNYVLLGTILQRKHQQFENKAARTKPERNISRVSCKFCQINHLVKNQMIQYSKNIRYMSLTEGNRSINGMPIIWCIPLFYKLCHEQNLAQMKTCLIS